MARPIQKRDDIERAVVDVVARQGLHATTIQDIARAAEVSPGLLYRYWKNRDDVARDAYQRRYRDLVTRIVKAGAPHADALRCLGEMIRAFLAFADDSPTELRFLLLAQHDLARTVPGQDGVLTHLTALLARAREDGSLAEDTPADLAAQFVLGLVLQPVVGVLYGDLPGPPSRYADQIEAGLARVLGAATPATHEQEA